MSDALNQIRRLVVDRQYPEALKLLSMIPPNQAEVIEWQRFLEFKLNNSHGTAQVENLTSTIDIRVHESDQNRKAETTCPLCGDIFIPDELTVQCEVCKSIYHKDCWKGLNDTCARNCDGASAYQLRPFREQIQAS